MRIKLVCLDCLGADGLRDFIRRNGRVEECGFCGSCQQSVPLAEVANYARDCIRREYELAEDVLPYCSAEGGFQGATCDTYDLLYDELHLELPRDSGGELRRRLVEQIGDFTWCGEDYYCRTRGTQLRWSWGHFCRVVRHQTRHFFHRVGDEHAEVMPPMELLQSIEEFLRDAGQVVTLEAGTKMFRVRVGGADNGLQRLSDYGPPPPELATQPNRMNPPGIPMLYTASDPETARAETLEWASSHWLGELQTKRELRIVDLVKLPRVPCFFSADASREPLAFLHEFRREVSAPVDRASHDHLPIRYAPTQVVSEYFRYMMTDGDGVDGFAFTSARNNSGTNYVLFPSQIGSEFSQGFELDRDFELVRSCFRPLKETASAVVAPESQT